MNEDVNCVSERRSVSLPNVTVTTSYAAFFLIIYGIGSGFVRCLSRLVHHSQGCMCVGVSLEVNHLQGVGVGSPGVGWIGVSLGWSITPGGGVGRYLSLVNIHRDWRKDTQGWGWVGVSLGWSVTPQGGATF